MCHLHNIIGMFRVSCPAYLFHTIFVIQKTFALTSILKDVFFGLLLILIIGGNLSFLCPSQQQRRLLSPHKKIQRSAREVLSSEIHRYRLQIQKKKITKKAVSLRPTIQNCVVGI